MKQTKPSILELRSLSPVLGGHGEPGVNTGQAMRFMLPTALQFILSVVLGAGSGFLLGRTRLTPVVQDLLATVGSITVALAILLMRVMVDFARAENPWGRCAGVDLTATITFRGVVLLGGSLFLLCVGLHFLLVQANWTPTDETNLHWPCRRRPRSLALGNRVLGSAVTKMTCSFAAQRVDGADGRLASAAVVRRGFRRPPRAHSRTGARGSSTCWADP